MRSNTKSCICSILALIIAIWGVGLQVYLELNVPQSMCYVCWFQRMCLFPLTIILIHILSTSGYFVIRYVLFLPLIGAILSFIQSIWFYMGNKTLVNCAIWGCIRLPQIYQIPFSLLMFGIFIVLLLLLFLAEKR